MVLRSSRRRNVSAEQQALAGFDPTRLAEVLERHGVAYVMIGAIAARLAGYPLATYDTDITPARDEANLERLAAALRELDARVYTVSVPEGLPFDVSARTLARGDVWNLVTSVGRVDILFHPAGSEGYEGLSKDASVFDVNGVHVASASLPAIVRMKEAAGRPKDLQAVAIIKAMLERDARRQH